MAKRRLGKGLDALIATTSTTSENKIKAKNSNIEEIEINLIEANPYQPRNNFAKDELKELSESIAEHGLLQPIIVRPKGDNYQIIAGERRYRAIKMLKLDKVKAIISKFDDQQMMELALIENLQREDLNPIEEAEAYQQLITKLNFTQSETAKRVGKSRSAIANSLRLLKLPNRIKNNVSRGTLSMGHARALLSIDNLELQEEIHQQIIDKELTVRETEKLIREINKDQNKSEKDKTKKVKRKDPNIIFVEDKLRDILGTQVEIKVGNKKGKIVIEYYSNQDLNRIIEQLGE